MAKWEFQQYPIFSMTLHRGWLCLLMASDAFIIHDVVLCYLPSPFNFISFGYFQSKISRRLPHGSTYRAQLQVIAILITDNTIQRLTYVIDRIQ
ncbi:unnamed protein product [Rotaria magnacalcarata]|uniref:Uncharacterized protein n=1 Tax=Rotaria magnacalcarata TaxID=392030 RepID=A0A816AVR5_9BILA|nr:unnamed protein product [Rotaria magnacalcarata]